MLTAIFAAMTMLSAIAIPPQRGADYALPARDQQLVRSSFESERFRTPSEAAFAASLRYGRTMLLSGEIGAKIYADIVQGGAPVFSYGPALYGQTDDASGDDVIEYDPQSADGHFAIVGVWHEHALDDTWLTLYGHYAEIAATHQAIWTTVRGALYAQYWDGARVMPEWRKSTPAIDPIERD